MDEVCELPDCQKLRLATWILPTFLIIVPYYESQTLPEFLLLTQSYCLTFADFYRMVEYFGMTLGYGVELFID